MSHYDIAAKVMVEKCRDELIRYFLGMNVRESVLIEELPQETVSLRRSDFPVKVTDFSGRASIVVVEFQTEWTRRVALRLLEYRTRHMLDHDLPAISCVVLLRPCPSATDVYEDEEIRYRYRLVRLYEMDARDIVEKGPECLLPFTPLMRNGLELARMAEELVYAGSMNRGDKADMLTAMAMFAGLISKDAAALLIARRRDIMIESAAYEIIKEEGFQQGLQQGLQQGVQQGVQQGIDEGIHRAERRAIHRLLSKGLSPAEVSRLLDMEEPEVRRIAAEPEE